MSKLKKEEILARLDVWMVSKGTRWNMKDEQAYRQIVALIEKPEFTEEFIKGKATEVYNLLYYKTFSLDQVTDFIRSLVEEIRGS